MTAGGCSRKLHVADEGRIAHLLSEDLIEIFILCHCQMILPVA